MAGTAPAAGRRWQNARRLDLVLGLMTLRARGDAREARYAAIVRAAFAAAGNRSHDPADVGHEWTTPVYQRTLSGSGCPDCYRAEAATRSKAGKATARAARDAAERAKIIDLPRRVSGDEHD